MDTATTCLLIFLWLTAPAEIKFANNYQFTRNIVGRAGHNKGVLSAVHKDSVGLFWAIRKDLRHSEVLCAHCKGDSQRPPAAGLTERRWFLHRSRHWLISWLRRRGFEAGAGAGAGGKTILGRMLISIMIVASQDQRWSRESNYY